MQRSSETIGAIAAALAKAQAELANPEKSLIGDHSRLPPARKRSDLPLRRALQRARHRPQIAGRARNRDRADHGDRQGGGTDPPDHGARPFVGRMAVVGMAGVRAQRDGGAAPDGGGADLRPALRPVHPGRHRGRRRSGRAGPRSRRENRRRPSVRKWTWRRPRMRRRRRYRSRRYSSPTRLPVDASASRNSPAPRSPCWRPNNPPRCAIV